MNAERLLVGLAAPFGQASANDSKLIYRARHFTWFANVGFGLPLRLEHAGVMTPYGYLTDLGRVLSTAIVTGSPTVPDGLLALAELDKGDWADSLLQEVTRGLLPAEQAWGLSLGDDVSWNDERSEVIAVMPRELSLTRSPALPGAWVLAVGPRALSVWELLSASVSAPID